VGHTGEMRKKKQIILVGKIWKRQIGRPGIRWENSIKMDLNEIGAGRL
jgi:hypothetical protein